MTNISKFLNPDGYATDINPATSQKISSVIAASTSVIDAGRFVVDTGSGFIYPETNGTIVDGVITTKVDNSASSSASTKAYTAIRKGLVRMTSEAAVTKGDQIGVGAYGKCKTYAAGIKCGVALTASAGADDVIVVDVDLARSG